MLSGFNENVIFFRYAYKKPVILRGLTDNTVSSSACIAKLTHKYAHRPVIFSPSCNILFYNSDFILEIQIFMLEVNFTHTVWRPKGGAQHSKHAFLQERCACGTQSCEDNRIS